MDTKRHELAMEGEAPLLHGRLVYDVVACAFEVLREFGNGLTENSLVVEFGLREMPFDQQRKFDVRCKNVKASEFIPDLIVDHAVIVDTKVIDRISDHERSQMLNYFRICQLKVGVILNFYRRKLEWQRLVL